MKVNTKCHAKLSILTTNNILINRLDKDISHVFYQQFPEMIVFIGTLTIFFGVILIYLFLLLEVKEQCSDEKEKS